jgi:hypothetical protein
MRAVIAEWGEIWQAVIILDVELVAGAGVTRHLIPGRPAYVTTFGIDLRALDSVTS